MDQDSFIPISNGESWDFYLESLRLKEEIIELNKELSLTKNPIYCEECRSCGEVPGCCKPNRCKYLDQSQGEYDELVKENAKLRKICSAESFLYPSKLIQEIEDLKNELNDVYSTIRDNILKSVNEKAIKEAIKSLI